MTSKFEGQNKAASDKEKSLENFKLKSAKKEF